INYNEYASSYSALRSASSRVIEHIVDRLGESYVSKVLEIGCGTADYLYVLKENLGFEAYGFDKSTEMLKEGMLKHLGLFLVNADANERFPFDDSMFDFTFSINVIHYIDDLDQYFKEAYRVMKPEGTMLTIIANIDKMKETVSKYFPEFEGNKKTSSIFVEEVIDCMKNSGFDDIRTTKTDYTYNMRVQDMEPIKKKVFAWVRLLSEGCFEKGIEQMTEDINNGKGTGSENYIYIWGHK
ncbi:MAG: hypothetical protein A2Y23_04475, partial [Clostridiales bacterium GWB2_37_7]